MSSGGGGGGGVWYPHSHTITTTRVGDGEGGGYAIMDVVSEGISTPFCSSAHFFLLNIIWRMFSGKGCLTL